MKSKSYIFILLLISFFSFSTVNAQAQETADWEWDQYGISFSTPEGFKIKECTDTQLQGSVHGLKLSVTPFSDMGVSEDMLEDYTIQMATDQNFQELSDTEELELNGYSATYIAGTKNGKSALLMVMLDEEELNNFIVTITFPSNQKEDAINILESFSKTDADEAEAEDEGADEPGE